MSEEVQKPKRVLFVCLGNICRSPAAEAIFRKLVQDQKLGHLIDIDSAGTASYHTGKQADPRMREAAFKRGYEITSLARTLTPRDIRDFDLILAMDRDNFRNCHHLTSSPSPHIRLLSDYLEDPWPVDVPDPYYGGPEGFDYVIDMLEAACPKILASLRGDGDFV